MIVWEVYDVNNGDELSPEIVRAFDIERAVELMAEQWHSDTEACEDVITVRIREAESTDNWREFVCTPENVPQFNIMENK